MTKVYQVEIFYEEKSHCFEVPEDRRILEVADELNLDLPSSCHTGVCTTCAGKIISGEVQQDDAMGVSPELQTEGYVLMCVAYPLSNLKIQAGKEEEVYTRQFGK